jgi:hypothetical protein
MYSEVERLETKQSWPISRYYSSILIERLRKAMKLNTSKIQVTLLSLYHIVGCSVRETCTISAKVGWTDITINSCVKDIEK